MCPQNWLTRVLVAAARPARLFHYRAISGNSEYYFQAADHISGTAGVRRSRNPIFQRVNYGDLNDKGRILRRNCTTAATITDVGLAV